ncbi:MAG: transposase [Sulfuritalea sp.]|nr:transposase [Sulfuritalea sp.]
MARYKHIDTSPRLIAVDLERQLLPGTFEHALNHLVDRELDLSRFDARYKNDLTGASAYPPAMLLKVVLFAYSRGIVSSRDIEAACKHHVTFIALSGDSAPHFTTFAAFVSTLDGEIGPLFTEILLICDRMGLIGREMFAIDGVKLPSNASKSRSGTRADFARQADKMEAAAWAMLARHRENDALAVEPTLAEKDARQVERLDREAAQIRQWLSDHPEDRKGTKGKVIKSNRTDNESAKMATDAGYHSDANLKALAEQGRPALIADNQMRKRDERFQDQAKYKALPDPLYDKAHPKKAGHYLPRDFDYDAEAGTCICPAGKSLYQNGANCHHNGHLAVKFQGALRDCGPCTLRANCLRKPDTTKTRQVSFFYGKASETTLSFSDLMKQAIDSERGRALYGRRFATVEPVFGNIRHNKGLDRFTLRGQRKVDTQWKLYCLVHNIEKLAHHGYAQ